MEIRFVLPSEAAQLARNVVSSFPSKTPDALLRNMESELYQPDEGATSAVLTTMGPWSVPS